MNEVETADVTKGETCDGVSLQEVRTLLVEDDLLTLPLITH